MMFPTAFPVSNLSTRIWGFPEIGGGPSYHPFFGGIFHYKPPPVIIHFHGIFHEINHPLLGTPMATETLRHV